MSCSYVIICSAPLRHLDIAHALNVQNYLTKISQNGLFSLIKDVLDFTFERLL